MTTPAGPQEAQPLAPCPFCGAGRNIYNINADWVTHRSPGCPLDNKTMTLYNWNRRPEAAPAPLLPLVERVKELEELLEHGCLKCGYVGCIPPAPVDQGNLKGTGEKDGE